MMPKHKVRGKSRISTESNGRPTRVPVPDEFCQQLVVLQNRISDLNKQAQAVVLAAMTILDIPKDYVLDIDQKAFMPPDKVPDAKV